MSDSDNQTVLQLVFDYEPNVPIAIAVSAITGTIAFALFIRLLLRRDFWGLCLPIGMAGYCAGFALRTPVRHNPNDLGLFIAMQLLTVTLPATFLAFNYIVYGRFVRNRVGPGYSFINPRKIALVFVLSDISTFMVQGAGGGIETSSSTAKLGTTILLVGLVLQIISYIFFVGLIAYTHRAVNREGKLSPEDVQWRTVWLLYFSSVFILIRGLYRVVEFAQGNLGFLITHEAYFYTLDALPLILATVIYVPFWPGPYVEPRKEGIPMMEQRSAP